MHGMKKIIIGIVVVLVVGVAGYVFLTAQAKKSAIAKISNFEECAKYFPVREMYPEQCVTSDGRTFTREIPPVEEGILTPPSEVETSTSTAATGTATTTTDPRIRVETPKAHAKIASPFVVKGQARGTWYFEASFPVKLVDEKGAVIAQTPAQAQGEWMTEDFVPFEATLTFTATSGKGTLVLERDNPSGLPQNDAQVRIPVTW